MAHQINPFPEPRRQSPAALIFFALRVVNQLVRQWWPVLIIFLFRQDGQSRKVMVILGLVFLGAFLILRSALAFFRFTFYLEDNSLAVEQGVLRREKVNIPFDRIQAVNFEQDIIHQALNVVKVNVDTAGSAAAEVSFSALTREDAEALRSYILSQRKEEIAEAEGAEDIEEAEEKTDWIQLSLQDLVKVGLGQNHIRTALIIIGFFFSILNRVEEAVGWEAEDVYYRLIGIEPENWWNLAIVALPFFLVASVLISLVRSVLRYFGLRVWRTRRGYRLTAGLLQRREQEVNLVKVQLARGRRTWLERMLKQHTYSLKQASSKSGGGGSFLVPGLTDASVGKLLEPIYAGSLREEKDTFGVSAWYRWRLILFRGIVPALLLTGGSLFAQNVEAGVLAGVWLILAAWWSFRYCATYRISLNGEILDVERGVFTRRRDLLAHFKVQAVTMRQSPYQRRHKLASLTLHTAGGDLRLPFIPLERVQKLRDYFLYRTETDNRDWM